MINILGLALSLACTIVIFRYVHGEMTVDHFNSKLDRLFLTTYESTDMLGNVIFLGLWNPNNEEAFVDLSEHPGLECHAKFFRIEDGEMEVNGQLYNAGVLVANTNYLQVLDYPIRGLQNFTRPEDAFVTEDFCKKIFGDENPVGKKIFYPSLQRELTIAGTIGKLKTKSTIEFDIILCDQLAQQWGKIHYSLILLHPGVDYREINARYNSFFDMSRWSYDIRYQLYPLKNYYFNTNYGDSYRTNHNDYQYVIILAAIGTLILLIGIVNFINIFNVVVLRRGREFGMKKVFGAEGFRVFSQLYVENMILIALALLFALGLTEILNPFVKNILGFDQFPYMKFDLYMCTGLLLLLPAITTIFPFFRYNYSTPVTSIRQVSGSSSSGILHRVFLIFQHVIAIVLIVLSLFFIKQLYCMLNKDLGYQTQDIIQVPFLKSINPYYYALPDEKREAKWEQDVQTADEIRQQMDASPLFAYWVQNNAPNNYRFTSNYSYKGETKSISMFGVDEKWLKLFEIRLLDGRLFDNNVDVQSAGNLIVGESVLKLFGISDFREAELIPIYRYTREGDEPPTPHRIIGVVKDIYTSHLSQPQNPIGYLFSTGDRYDQIRAAILPGKRQEAIQFLKQLHEETVGGEFTYTFLEDEVAETYKEDKRIATIYTIFTIIAILISALGLFSMSLFDVQQQRRSIAIRKVNGATAGEIVRMLLKRYLVLLAVAFVIAAPIAYIAIRQYIKDFTFQTAISWWLFAIAFVLTAAISLVTLIYQTRKAASQNPAEVVKTE